MAANFTYRKRVEFSETDMAGIVHFANFFRWMEAAECELLEQLGVPLIAISGDSMVGWPRTKVHCEFHAPLRFRDEVEVQLEVLTVKLRAVEYRFQFYKIGGEQPVHVASGGMTTVFAHRDALGMSSRDIPADIAEALAKQMRA